LPTAGDERIFDMTMLTHNGGQLERGLYSSERRDPAAAAAAAARLATIKRFFMHVLMLLGAGTMMAAIMALKVAVYLPRFIHH